jgi:hypothetical protein
MEPESSLPFSQEPVSGSYSEPDESIPFHSHCYFTICFNINFYLRVGWNRDSSVGIATGNGLDDRRAGILVPVASRIFSSPRRPDRLWGPLRLLSNGYWG